MHVLYYVGNPYSLRSTRGCPPPPLRGQRHSHYSGSCGSQSLGFGSVSPGFFSWCFIFVDVANLIGQGIDPIGFANLKRVHFHAPLELVHFIISQENVRSKRLKIRQTYSKWRQYCLFWTSSFFRSFRKTK